MGPRAMITDELPDRLLFRPLAAVLVRPLVKTPITPNQITIVSALFGVASGVALATRHTWVFTLLIGVMLTLDCADGQLARLRGGGDIWGRIADGIADYVTALAFHVGLDHLARDGLWLGARSAVGPRRRRQHGVERLPDGQGEAALPRRRRRRRGRAACARRGAGAQALLHRRLPAVRLGREPRRPDRGSDVYQQRLRPALALWLWLGPTTHYAVAAVLIAFDQPLLYAVAAVVLFNLVTVFAILLTRRLEASLPDPGGTRTGSGTLPQLSRSLRSARRGRSLLGEGAGRVGLLHQAVEGAESPRERHGDHQR